MTSGIIYEEEQIQRLLEGLIPQEKEERCEQEELKSNRVIVISGPTASGKTELSLILASQLNGEVISADSMQVYKGMDVGTAKVTLQEQKGIRHHLIDLCDVDDPFTVVHFFHAARQAIRDIQSRNKVPIVVGGTGFYLRALLYGPPSGPAPIPELRESLEREADRLGCESLYEHLQHLDPIYAETITPRDRQKIIRGLEIVTLSGGKVSDLPWEKRDQPLDYDFRCWFVYRPREILYERIEDRCEHMLEQGLIHEVQGLLQKGLKDNRSASNAIGYRQTIQFLESKQGEADYEHYVQEFKKASRHYAKRQFTWFKRQKEFRWLNVDIHDIETAAEFIMQDVRY